MTYHAEMDIEKTGALKAAEQALLGTQVTCHGGTKKTNELS